ncbi:MAG: type II secretion system protein [Opitutaceae bacterium]|nr:type II secretion system protein [Opitutaceae bacterium]
MLGAARPGGRPVEDWPYLGASVRRLSRVRGFTLLEVMLVVALIAVAGTMFLVSVESLGKSSPADEFEGAFWRAMAQAREQALTSRRPVELAFDPEAMGFLLANDFILVRGELVTRRPVEGVRIFPDGSCQAFAIEFQLGTYKHRVQIDPWTGSEMLSAEADKKGRL